MATIFDLGENDCYTLPGEWRHMDRLYSDSIRRDVVENPEILQVRSDDCFVVTYPKSGTTWTLEMTRLFMNDGVTSTKQHNILPFLELKVDKKSQDSTLYDGFSITEKMESSRLVKSHLPVGALTKDLFTEGCKIIVVARNPKDVAVSFYYFYKSEKESFGDYDGDFHHFLRMFMNGKVLYGDWFTHVLEWWQRCRDNKNILFLKYEDMKKDPRSATVRIADYLGYDLNDDVIDKITEHCSFKNMKKAPAIESTVRKGIVGDWKNYFTVAENEAFERIYNEKMKGTGLSFEW